MKTLEFKKLTLQNFLSIGNTPLEFVFKDGLNLITGYNRDDPQEKNGIGKSSICDGIFFALFNETLKDLNMGDIINDKTKKECMVSLQFSIIEGDNRNDYEVIRTLKPSNCYLLANGEDVSRSKIPETNAEISKILSISKELFKQSIVMSIGKSTPFFLQPKAEKRKFIEGIFNLEIFSQMLADSRSGYNYTKTEKEHVQSRLTNEQSRLKQFEEKHNSFEISKQQVINMLKEQYNTDIEKIKELTKSLAEEQSIDDLNEKYAEVNSKLKKIDELIIKVEIKLSEINSGVKRLTSEIENTSDDCPTCGRPFADKTSRQEINDKKRVEIDKLSQLRIDYLDKRKTISDKKNEILEERDVIKVKIASIKSTLDHNQTINSHIATLKNACLQNKQKIKTKSEEVSEFEDLIVKAKKDIESLDSEYNELHANNKIYDFCKFILSEEGVKSVIVNRLKNLLNTKVNWYLDKLGSSLTCKFDEYFSETLYNKNGVEKAYDSFSGGESKRIDLAILLTFQDVLRDQTGIHIKLALYDEILDSSIDESGRKNVLRILKDKSDSGIPIYIISHRGKMSDLIDNEIVLEKHNDWTYLKEIK